jgi:hypothetical protein
MKRPPSNGKLKIPLDFEKAVSSFLRVKPEPKKPKKSQRKQT